jgi:hypothetical protein
MESPALEQSNVHKEDLHTNSRKSIHISLDSPVGLGSTLFLLVELAAQIVNHGLVCGNTIALT